jgi:hypothetical protein
MDNTIKKDTHLRKSRDLVRWRKKTKAMVSYLDNSDLSCLDLAEMREGYIRTEDNSNDIQS